MPLIDIQLSLNSRKHRVNALLRTCGATFLYESWRLGGHLGGLFLERTSKNPELIAGLDLVRFSAAAMVMLYHFGAGWVYPHSLSSQILDGRVIFPDLLAPTRAGFVGVEIFFVISGIVISYSASLSSARDFLVSRVLRLYPATWICASISTISLLIFSTSIGYDFDGRRTMLEGLVRSLVLHPIGPWADAAYWTLGIEMTFYAVVFLLLLVLSFRRIMAIAYVFGLISASYWIIGAIIAREYLQAHLWDRWRELSLHPSVPVPRR